MIVNTQNSVCAGSEPTGVGFGVLGLLRFLARCLTEFPIHMYIYNINMLGGDKSRLTIENVWLRCNLCSLSGETYLSTSRSLRSGGVDQVEINAITHSWGLYARAYQVTWCVLKK